jgi:hypothetical protein
MTNLTIEKLTQQRQYVLNRLTGRMERMTPAEEAAYHVELCLHDMADPKASAGRKQRATNALAYWRAQP